MTALLDVETQYVYRRLAETYNVSKKDDFVVLLYFKGLVTILFLPAMPEMGA